MEEEDELLWVGDSPGSFSVKSMIDLAINQHNEEDPLSGLAWRGLAPPRVHMFVWCALKGNVLSLNRKGLLRSDDLHYTLYGHF